MAQDVIAGRYELQHQLGHGSMGDVWLAHDRELGRSVALKLLAPDADRARFEREARAVAVLAHPNVTRVYDYGEADGRPYIVFEYLGGGTLEERLSSGRPLPDDAATAIATQLAAGLAHAHEQGLVHRDLKPANVLFDDEGRPKIADFGIASIAGGPTLTEAGTVLGTAAYISPEQAAGQRATPASDVYSFGVIVFRMVTGRLPFESESPLELAEMHRRLDAPAVERFRPEAPRRLTAVTAAALRRNPNDRLPDGRALLAELRLSEATAGSTASTLVLPRVRRGRTPLALAAALVLLAAAGILAAVLLAHESSSGTGTTVSPRPKRTRTHTTSSAPAPLPAPTPSTAASSTTRPRTTVPSATTGAPTTTQPTTTGLPTTVGTTVTLPIP